jgi:uncharacterized protein (DUF427 family)
VTAHAAVARPRSAWAERPDYRVDLLTRTNRMTAWLGDAQLASSDACLVVDEQDHGLVVYFPPDAVNFSLLAPIDDRTVCPFKGQAVYWRAVHDVGGSGADGSGAGAGAGIAWSYPEPFPPVAPLAGYIAFDQEAVRVTIGKGVYTGLRP